VAPELVKRAAFVAFSCAMVFGLVLVLMSQVWALLAIGAFALIAAWFYTGGRRPYGYQGFGEVVVFVFFGWVATVGTAWAMVGAIAAETWLTGAGAGFFASSVLLVNNIRDRETDAQAGKKTLAVRLGDRGSRVLLVALLVMPYVIVALLSLVFVWAPLVFITGVMTVVVIVIVLTAQSPRELITALSLISVNAVLYALGLAGAIAF
jgi:1,4-dihydroxy-2-naphthoate octaprenyltransferase